MAPSLRSNSGTTRSINGNSGIGGVSSSSGASSSRLFQHRGALTKLSTSSSTSFSIGGGSRSSVPRPVNTSSLRKENGGQDISAVLVNRHGGKKLGWGSSLPDKTPAPASSDTPPPPTNATDVPSNNRMPHHQGIGIGRSRSIAPLDPTPEEALAAAEASKKKDLPSNNAGSCKQQDTKGSTLDAPVSQNTPWALHAPTPQPRDPITGMPPVDSHDNRGHGGAYNHPRPPDPAYSRYYNGQVHQYNNHYPSPSHYHHNQDYQDGGGGSYNYRYNDDYQNHYHNSYRGTRARYDRDNSSGPYDRHNQHHHQYQSNFYDNHRDNRYDYQSNYNQRRYDDRVGDDGGGYYRDRRERYHHQYPPTSAGLGAIDHPNSHRDRHSYRNDMDSRNANTSGQHYGSHQYRRGRGGEEGYDHPLHPEVNDKKDSGDISAPTVQNTRIQRDMMRRDDTGEYERDVATPTAGSYDPRYDRRLISNNRDYNRPNPNYHRYQRDSGRGGGYERKHDYKHHTGLTSPLVEEEHEDEEEDDVNDEKGCKESSPEVANEEKVKGKENESVRKQDCNQNEDREKELSKEAHNSISEEESGNDAPKQILRHNSQLSPDGDSKSNDGPFANHSAEEASNISLERLVAVDKDKHQTYQLSQTQTESTCTDPARPSPDKSRDDGLSLDTETLDENENSDDDDLSDGSLDPAHEIALAASEKKANVTSSSEVGRAGSVTTKSAEKTQVIDRELVLKQQQQSILKKVEAARKERRRGSASATMTAEDLSKPPQNQNQQNMGNSDDSITPPPSTNDSRENRVASSTTIELSEEDRVAREVLRKEYLVKWAAERAARIAHRRTRNPRTRGVLFRRLDDGSLMNADLSEKEIAKRLERKSKKESKIGKMSTSSSLPSGKASASASMSESLSSARHRGRHGKSKSKVGSNTSSAIVDDETPHRSSTSVEPVKETKAFVPSPGPSVSAWVAGPPPGMVKKQPEQQQQQQQQSVESHSITSPSQLDKKNNHRHGNKRNSSNTASRNVEDVASKLDRVLSSNLLDIANSASWSSKPNASGNTKSKQHTKVAVGPIMSDWTAFAGGQVDYPYESFGDSSAKPSENSTPVEADGESRKSGGTSTSPPPSTATVPGTGTDWSILPHDLLSSVADSDDRDTSESIELKNGGKKYLNSSKNNSRNKGRRKPPHNQQRSNNNGSSSSKKKNHSPKSNDTNAKKSKSSRRHGTKPKKDVTGVTKKKSNRSVEARPNGTSAQPRPPP